MTLLCVKWLHAKNQCSSCWQLYFCLSSIIVFHRSPELAEQITCRFRAGVAAEGKKCMKPLERERVAQARCWSECGWRMHIGKYLGCTSEGEPGNIGTVPYWKRSCAARQNSNCIFCCVLSFSAHCKCQAQIVDRCGSHLVGPRSQKMQKGRQRRVTFPWVWCRLT